MKTLLFLLALTTMPLIGHSRTIDFNRDIRPILTTQCTACHGGVKEAGGISFVFREKALATGDSGTPTIVPGKPDASELIHRITSADPEVVMPQPEHGPPLSREQIATLRQWILEGAHWDEHWAFTPPQPPAIPTVSQPSWVRNPIDAFILHRLDQEKLEPSPPATPALLLRRLSIDLTGLPPSLADLDRFENASQTDPETAYTSEVDRLLASPHFGERWAAVWLDLARYADTEGLGLDRPRPAWPYRDWVIRAYNQDLPFDRFTISQLAGDLLPQPSLDDLIATNFHRQTQANAEGGTDDEEFRVTAVMDRVATTWETWQGLTMGCVQCHSHPYDPIAHQEYYQSFAFFNNTRDHDLDSHFPTLPVPRQPQDSARFARWIQEKNSLLRDLDAQQDQLRSTTAWTPVHTLGAHSPHVALKVEKDGTFFTDGNVPTGSVFHLNLSLPPADTPLTALRLHILPVNPTNALHTPEWGSVISHLQLFLKSGGNPDQPVEIREIIGDEPDPHYPPNSSLNPDAHGWGPYTKIDRPRSAVLVLQTPLPRDTPRDLELRLTHKEIGGGSFPLVTKRGRLDLTDDPRWTSLPEEPQRSLLLARLAEIQRALHSHRTVNLPVIEEQPPSLRRPTHLFVRGNWLEKDQPIPSPQIPAIFGQLPESAPKDRLAFARWLVSAENPLTARVTVNRFWEQLFGTGLVETLEDFGSSGAKPSHPQLLDHLALHFRNELAWSQKALLREIVLSNTYRQSSQASPANTAADPRNRLLSRGPRGRLSAEAIRDHSLVVSGMLTPTLYGPPVFPPMPQGGWTPFKSGEKWDTPAPGQADRYRRSIYTYTKRSNPYPGFATFDAPPRDLCTKRRVLSNTPLQALETLNSPAHSEFAQGLARRMKGHPQGSIADRLALGYRIATSRHPQPDQLASLTKLFSQLENHYRSHPADFQGMAGTPDGAAYTVLASVLINLDEALTR